MVETAQHPTRLVIVLAPSFNMSATMGFIDPFRASNYLDGQTYFKWDFASETGGFCVSSNGAGIDTHALSDLSHNQPEIVIISTSWNPEKHLTDRLGSVLRQWARSGATLGALDTGAFVLAQAGLLKGRRATVHYEHIDAFQELYPDIEVVKISMRWTATGSPAVAAVPRWILRCRSCRAFTATRWPMRPRGTFSTTVFAARSPCSSPKAASRWARLSPQP